MIEKLKPAKLAYSANSICELLDGISRKQIARAIANGTLPTHKLGVKVRVLTSDIIKWAESWPAPKRKRIIPHGR
jgi:excisionase family DNA binding protein